MAPTKVLFPPVPPSTLNVPEFFTGIKIVSVTGAIPEALAIPTQLTVPALSRYWVSSKTVGYRKVGPVVLVSCGSLRLRVAPDETVKLAPLTNPIPSPANGGTRVRMDQLLSVLLPLVTMGLNSVKVLL